MIKKEFFEYSTFHNATVFETKDFLFLSMFLYDPDFKIQSNSNEKTIFDFLKNKYTEKDLNDYEKESLICKNADKEYEHSYSLTEHGKKILKYIFEDHSGSFEKFKIIRDYAKRFPEKGIYEKLKKEFVDMTNIHIEDWKKENDFEMIAGEEEDLRNYLYFLDELFKENEDWEHIKKVFYALDTAPREISTQIIIEDSLKIMLP